MLGICFILGLLALALAAPTPNSHKLRDVAPPVGSLLIKPSVEVDSGSHGTLLSSRTESLFCSPSAL